MKLLYFAWLRTRIGKGEETLTPPTEVRTVRALLDWLKDAVARPRRGAQEPRCRARRREPRARPARRPRRPDDEVALFPPVTGG